MILALDVGNSQIYGGVFDSDNLKFQFRRTSQTGVSSDEYGLFLKSVLRENGIDPASIQQVTLCTVVPDVLHSLRNACIKYFNLTPFVLQTGVKTGLKINYSHPQEVGSDRIANAIAATHLYPNKNLIIVDFGTATTFCAINARHEYLGGLIMAGMRISMQSLESKTAKLPSVEIVVPRKAIGRNTVEGIQSGLYFGTLGMIKEIKEQITQEVFPGEQPLLIGTGGMAGLFRKTGIFDHDIPDLVLKGLYLALKMNL